MTEIDTLLAEREITRGLGRFARILDQKEWSALGDVFAPDVTFDYGADNQGDGIEALEQRIRKFLDVCGPTQHLIGSIVIDVSGSDAVSHAYVQARHQRDQDPAGAIFDSTGEYVDRWQRRDTGWRIIRRDAVWFLHAGDPGVLAVANDKLG